MDFLNSVPLSLIRTSTLLSELLSKVLIRMMISLAASALEDKNLTQVYLEKSYTMTTTYFFPDRDGTFTEPNKSTCSKNIGLIFESIILPLCTTLLNFPFRQSSHNPS